MGPCVLAWRRAGRADCGLPSIVLVGCVCGLYKHIVRTNLRLSPAFRRRRGAIGVATGLIKVCHD